MYFAIYTKKVSEATLLNKKKCKKSFKQKCDTAGLKVNTVDYHSWFMPDSWSVDVPNSAVPYSEMIPCSYDDVYFSDYMNTAAKLDSGSDITVKSINFGNASVTQDDLDNLDERLYPWIVRGDAGFGYGGRLLLSGQGCKDPEGCECHSLEEQIAICDYQSVLIEKKFECYDPLEPFFGCVSDQMCGWYNIHSY